MNNSFFKPKAQLKVFLVHFSCSAFQDLSLCAVSIALPAYIPMKVLLLSLMVISVLTIP